MIEAKTAAYTVEPSYLEHVGNTLRRASESAAFPEACEEVVTPLLAETHEITGLDNVPDEGPLIVIKNHPFHFDFLAMDALYSKRPDVRLLVKTASYSSAIPEDNALFLRKNGAKADPQDVAALQAYLRDGGSMVATPWGAMDHQANSYATLERAAQNAARYVTFGSATLLPVHVDATWGDTKGLPVQNVSVSIQEPIPATDADSAERIYAEISKMYQTYVTGESEQ